MKKGTIMAGIIASLLGLYSGADSKAQSYKVAEVYQGLRQRVLEIEPSSIGITASKSGSVWAVLMETGYPGAVATLVTIADGTVSLYFSNGGGIIGVGEHDGPRQASMALLAAAPSFLPHMKPTKEFPLPRKDNTRFYLLTFQGAFTFEAPEEDLGNGRLPLSPLFMKAHDVITQARMADEKARGK